MLQANIWLLDEIFFYIGYIFFLLV